MSSASDTNFARDPFYHLSRYCPALIHNVLYCRVGDPERLSTNRECETRVSVATVSSAVGGREVATRRTKKVEEGGKRGGREERPQAIKTFAPR